MQPGLLRLFFVLTIGVSLVGCEQPSTPTSTNKADTLPVTAGTLVGQQRPDFSLQDTDGRTRSINEWSGKVLVINFWATWCPPCRKEIPAFVDLQEQYGKQGLQFIGIAIDEKDKVSEFSDTYGVNYPMLLGTLDAIELGKRYGNSFGALPYTIIVGKDGKIAYIQRGELLKTTAEAEIKKLL